MVSLKLKAIVVCGLGAFALFRPSLTAEAAALANCQEAIQVSICPLDVDGWCNAHGFAECIGNRFCTGTYNGNSIVYCGAEDS